MTQIAFIAVLIVFIMISLIINLSISIHNSIQADDITLLISENGGIAPEFVSREDEEIAFPGWYNEESPFRIRYFLVNLKDNKPVSTDISHIASVKSVNAFRMAEKALAQGDNTGYVDEYRFRLVRNSSEDYLIFLDCYENFRLRKVTLLITLGIFLGFTALITVIFGICSKYVLKPFEENSRKQKQFVTDASHELKTPLAIISANAEVLEYKNGSNKWTRTIADEAAHMGELINQLLTLAKLEEASFIMEKESFDLSETAVKTLEKFTEVVTANGAEFISDIQPGIIFSGSREQLTQLVSILTENAAKYVTEGGKISVKLFSRGKKVFFSVFNTADIDPDENYDRVFDRFYRTDKSRSSDTGGHGIGLSIAKHICTIYDGDIKAVPKDGGLEFAAVLINSK